MADARERAKNRRETQRRFHLARIKEVRETEGEDAALDRAYDYFKAARQASTDADAADRISAELFQFMITKAAEFPRRSPQ